MTTQNDSRMQFVPERVSVIIPTYNYARYLPETLNSVFCQNIADLEVVIVDDGSTDDTKRVLEPYSQSIKYVYQENGGQSAARNNGIKNCSGEFLLFLDADDILAPNVIEKQKDFLNTNPHCDICVCRNKLFHETTVDGHPKVYDQWNLFHSALDVHLCFLNIAPPHAFFCRRQAVLETGDFDTSVNGCEDYDFWLRAAVIGHIPTSNPSTIVYYRRHPDSVSANANLQYPIDVTMHQRVAQLLRNFPDFPKGKRIEGLLAFAAGALRTAKGMQSIHMNGWLPLLEMVDNLLTAEQNAPHEENFDWNLLASLFYLRILNVLMRPPFRYQNTAGQLMSTLRSFIYEVTGYAAGSGFHRALLSSTLEKNRALSLERKEVIPLLVKYAKNGLSILLNPA